MDKLRILLALGIFVGILPYLGFPFIIKNILITLSGLAIVYLSYILYEENNKIEIKEKIIFENFSENHDFTEKKAIDNQEISQKE